MVDLSELTVQSPAEWRDWLEQHHADHPGVWLVLHKKGGSVTSLIYADALDEALCFGWIDGQIRRRDNGSYCQRFTPRRSASSWSARNVEHVARLTIAGLMGPAGVAAVNAAKADGRWQAAYQGQANAQTPTDLSEALAINSAAAATFDNLDSANRYAIIYRLNAAKLPQTRARKLTQYVEMLSRGETIHPQKSKGGRP
ncbi:MAG TPA: YdeI/OmpD-associated family protein [Mycobacteriales bacterium]|nr:YdeI/OmpD-associated family protein [Mycobacteriales bacterium]